VIVVAAGNPSTPLPLTPTSEWHVVGDSPRSATRQKAELFDNPTSQAACFAPEYHPEQA